MAAHGPNGVVRLTASGAVGVAGKPLWIDSITLTSGGTASVLSVLDKSAGTEYVKMSGTINTGVTVSFENGLFFPAGAYLSLDANATYATVGYTQQQTD